MDYPDFVDGDVGETPRTSYDRCTWCHGVRERSSMIYKNNKPFCCAKHMEEWEAKNLTNNWLGGK